MQLQEMGKMDRVDAIFKAFQGFDIAHQRNILVGLIQTSDKILTCEIMSDLVQSMAHEEAEALTQKLIKDFGYEAGKKTVNPSVTKLQRFVAGLGATMKAVNAAESASALAAEQNEAEAKAERATFEKMLLLRSEMHQMKENHEVELQFEQDKIKILEDECKELMAKYQDALKRIPRPVDTTEKAIQADVIADTKRKKFHDEAGGEKDPFKGISDVVAEANLSAKKIRKIFAKKRAFTLPDVTGQIVTLYQAKMTQDIHDDFNGKSRSAFLGLIEDIFILYYGLKELAIGQLLCIDTAIHKFCETNARVRLFGMLIGSNAPTCTTQRMGRSPEALDFFLFVVGIVFHVGHYATQYDHALATAKVLKSRFGDGIPHSPHSTRIHVGEAIHAVQIAFAFDENQGSAQHSDCVQLVKALALDETIDLDQFLEQVMLHWFTIYDSQVVYMKKLFERMDEDKNGVLEFHEFIGVVQKLDPEMTQRDALALYNRVAGTDNVIDCKEFTSCMIRHQQNLILKTYFGSAKLHESSGGKTSFVFHTEKTLKHLSAMRDKSSAALNELVQNEVDHKSRHAEAKDRHGAIRRESVAQMPCNIMGRLREMVEEAPPTDEFVDDTKSHGRPQRRSFSTENWDTTIDEIIRSVVAHDR
ncbi:unnamed protein product [Aphanomyces euteiches]